MTNKPSTVSAQWMTIIGDPIEFAFSPALFNAMFSYTGRPAHFFASRVSSKELPAAVAGLRILGAAGFSVTMPHKEAIIPCLDWVDQQAKAVRSVNTVVRTPSGALHGYTTDGDGFVAALVANEHTLAGARVCMLGSGGAGRSIAYSLAASKVAGITICSLQKEELEVIQTMVHNHFNGVTVHGLDFSEQTIADAIREADLCINATPLGMEGSQSPHVDFIPWEDLSSDVVFAEVVHTPQYTPLLQRAKEHGHPVISGQAMVLHQAVLAYRLVFDDQPLLHIMQQGLETRR